MIRPFSMAIFALVATVASTYAQLPSSNLVETQRALAYRGTPSWYGFTRRGAPSAVPPRFYESLDFDCHRTTP